MLRKKSYWIFVLLICLTVSCTPHRTRVYLNRADFAPVKLAYVDFRIEKNKTYDSWGDKIGLYDFRITGCRRQNKEITLNKGRVMQRDMDFFDSFFLAVNDLYPVSVPKTNPYFVYSDQISQPEYLISAEIKDLFLNVCDEYDWDKAKYSNLRKGSAEIEVTWRVTDLAKRKTFWKGTTNGYSRIEDPVTYGEIELVEKAFEDSAHRMVLLRGFKETLANRRSLIELSKDFAEIKRTEKAHIEKRNKAIEKIKDSFGGVIPQSTEWWGDGHDGWKGVDGWLGKIYIDPQETFTKLSPENMYRLRTGVVSIENKNGGIGAGLLISPQLILTSDTVVDGHSNLKIKTINNRIDVAMPIRRHSNRDVALVYRKPTKFYPLPLRLDLPEIGEEVYFSLGAPNIETGEGFLEDKGIVTGYRYTDGGVEIMVNTFVQEKTLGGALIDKNGNVLGMAHSGIRLLPDETDYFIPIADALQKLDVEIKGVPFPKKDIRKEWVPVNNPNKTINLPSSAEGNIKEIIEGQKQSKPDKEVLPNLP